MERTKTPVVNVKKQAMQQRMQMLIGSFRSGTVYGDAGRINSDIPSGWLY
jgi:hypothetical protein